MFQLRPAAEFADVLNEAVDLPDRRSFELIALDDALDANAKLDP
jgi:hypothetical protein